MKNFDELGLAQPLLQAIGELGYEHPMPVQEEVIPYLLNNDTDLVALAQTGTGKTAAYGLPLLQKTIQDRHHLTISDSLQTLSGSPKTLSNSPLKGENTGEDSTQKVSPLRGDLEGSGDRIGFGSLERPVKLSPGQTIDINTADTTQLKLIPGIASKRAARIVAYRQSLGGFVSVEQAMEAIEMPDSVLRYMTVTPVELAKINVNRLSVQQMMRHPYLSFYQAKAIFEHRRNKGELHSIEELSRLDSFKPSDIDRLRPYIEF